MNLKWLRPETPEASSKLWSMVLAVLVHVGLAAFLFIGVRWELRPPAPLEVELVGAPQPPQRPAAPAPAPKPQPAPAPKPQPQPEPPPPPPPKPVPPKPEPKPAPPPPPKPEPKPEPVPAPKPVPPKPEPKPEPPPPKPEPKPEPPPPPPPPKPEPEPPKPEPKPEPPKPEPPKPEPKPEPPAPKPEPKPPAPPPPKQEPPPKVEPLLDNMESLLAQEMQRARAATARTSTGMAEYQNLIRLHVRSRLVIPPGLQGNPEALFKVTQRPDGSVAAIQLVRSSGTPALDAAIERAIQAASPLPLPSNPALFDRELNLTFRPLVE